LSTDELLEEVADRGLTLKRRGGAVVLVGPTSEQTDALKKALRLPNHKEAILKRFGVKPAPPGPRPREWLWRFGQRDTESPDDATFGRPDCHPAGAWWWRYEGEAAWRLVPARAGDLLAHLARPHAALPFRPRQEAPT
jgi:hypothetical protein